MIVRYEDLDTRLTITVPEFAALIGIGTSAAYEAARRGEIPARRIGSRWILPVPLVKQWVGLEVTSDGVADVGLRATVLPFRDDLRMAGSEEGRES